MTDLPLPPTDVLIRLVSRLTSHEVPLYEDELRDGGAEVYMDLTVGWDPKDGTWSYQTGDNSFVGRAYHYPVWAVVCVGLRDDADTVARIVEHIIEQLEEGVPHD